MADLLNANEIFFTNLEYKVQNRFELYVDGIPSFLIYKCDRPKFSSETKIVDHINIQKKYKGKTTWEDITMELRDPIVPSGAQAVMEWVRLSHESVTGRDGYNDMYSKDITLNVLGPVGDKVEEWVIKGAFIKDADFGTLDYSNSGDIIPITLTISYNYAILQF